MDLTIKQGTNRFYIGETEETLIAEIIWEEREPGVLDVYRTFVDDSLRGQGVAGKLLDRLVEYARDNQLKLMPNCSYVEKKFVASSEKYADVQA